MSNAIKNLPVNLRNIAVKYSRQNFLLKDLVEKIRLYTKEERGKVSIEQSKKLILNAIKEAKPIFLKRKNAILPNVEDISHRLKNFKLKRIRKSFNACGYRNLSCDGGIYLYLVPTILEIGVKREDTIDWQTKYGRWSPKMIKLFICIFESYGQNILKKGISVVDGMFTLNAELIDTQHGIKLYKTCWLEQGRGLNLKKIQGYIVFKRGFAAHGSTPEKAFKVVNRKIKENRITKMDIDVGKHIHYFLEKVPNDKVTVSDARKIGACLSGIRNFCYQTGLDYDNKVSTLQDVYAAYQKHPLLEAKRTLCYVMQTLMVKYNIALSGVIAR